MSINVSVSVTTNVDGVMHVRPLIVPIHIVPFDWIPNAMEKLLTRPSERPKWLHLLTPVSTEDTPASANVVYTTSFSGSKATLVTSVEGIAPLFLRLYLPPS